MRVERARWVAILGSAGSLVIASWQFFRPDASSSFVALTLLLSLAALGTLLARVPQAFAFAGSAGIVGVISAALGVLAHRTSANIEFAALTLGLAIILLWSAEVLRRAGARDNAGS